MKWLPADCSPGDMVRVRTGSVFHYGIFVSEDEIIAFGLPPVPEYRDRPDRLTVLATDADTFSCGSIIEKAVFSFSEKRKKRAPAKIVEIARSRIGETGYNIIHNNCEHFANECVFGVARCSVEEEARRRWLSRPICDVYISEIGADTPPDAVYPPERDREIRECGNDALRAAKYADWSLLALASKRSLAVDFGKTVFKKTRFGRWCAEGFDFSLSHAGSSVAVAVSGGAVGVDIESISDFSERKASERTEKLRERFFTENERAAYPDEPLPFLSCWTKKEAEFKRRAHGSFDPASLDATLTDAASYLVNGKDGTVLSVSADAIGSLRVFTVRGDAVRLADLQRIR